MPELWERQKDEPTRAFYAFSVYRDMGPARSIKKTGDDPTVTANDLKFMEKWSMRYGWVARAQAYDDYLDALKRKTREDEIVEMAERHAKLAMAFQAKIAKRLQFLKPAELSPKDLSTWLDIATKLERISRGEPTEINKEEVIIIDDIT